MKTELLALVLLMVGFGGSPCNKEKNKYKECESTPYFRQFYLEHNHF